MMLKLAEKRKEVVAALASLLTSANSDVEQCLNSNYILIELADNEVSFPLVVEPSVLEVLLEA